MKGWSSGSRTGGPGSLSISREGDERTWFRVDYDQSRAGVADAIVDELLGMGFTVIDRTAC